ncbi:hypothetical protein DFA_10338 [Cavenderia fasciculata]|uniref:R3H domain-containing protein n=1 Tax=Cavenderia fasciculata TaxID=261658 RepID=F4Q9X9_CACFS|nr:uncharacterized protein DFA_10338 [Cavenderia fasciculata]EGG15498.1 hypothetical protein DFA_10338 [Cavenderia fasciculata]|eukprot:XP_004354240.1 hypothetical protein DFA_10338 [Cavenderia fasciculata]
MAEQRISEILWNQLETSERPKQEKEIVNTPSKKKKGSTRLCRDSQQSRESPGKPGSKRYNRFLNTQYLKEGGIFKDHADYEYNLVDQNENLLFQDNIDNWEPYVNITYDRQQESVEPFVKEEEDRRRQQRKNSRINHSFSRLRKDLREAFKQPFVQNSYFITEAEQRLLAFINDPLLESIEVALDMPFQRLLVHGLGSYYSLFTSSYTNQDSGKRLTVIRKPKIIPPMPEMSITEYVAQEQLKNKTPSSKSKNQQQKKSNNNSSYRSRSRSNSINNSIKA